MKETILYGTESIEYQVIRMTRKTLCIQVFANGNVIVKVPLRADKAAIAQKVHKRAAWIIRQRDFFKSFGEKSPERRYVSGESHLYLGRLYVLQVREGKPDEVKYKGRNFEMVCSSKDKAKSLMKAWYRERAKIKFPEYAEPIIQRFAKYGVTPSSLYIQEMKTHWGTCTGAGKIILNTELIRAPRPCIEYVITHELCHLVHHNHSRQFYALLSKEMPDWQKWKDKLEHLLW